ncbi:MAG: FmdB family transcriptional regulator [Actinomycetota bacterium]|nr:FmdB family transcriptional regulator [Actinomycetota bacterium]
MPTYQYTCTECGEPVEKLQKFSDAPLTECSVCGGRLRKVFSPVGIVFKGSGFYRTDSRKNGVVPADAGTKDKPSGDSASSAPAAKESSSASGSSDSDSKPAAKKSSETASTPSKSSSSSSSSEKVA